MPNVSQAKVMAKALRAELSADGVEIPHAKALEIVARQFGFSNWNILAAQMKSAETDIRLQPAIPIIRIFDEEKALDFYRGYLGFAVDWEHRHAPDLPLYAQVSRGDCLLHLSGHHGDATPGGRSFIRVEGIEDFHRDLQDRKYPNLNPGIKTQPWGTEVPLVDPFGNHLTFCEQRQNA